MADLPSPRTRILHVFTLSAFAVAQPLFDLLGRNASFFVAHRARAVDVLLFVVAALIVVPAILVGIDALTKWRAHAAIVAALAALAIVPPIVRATDLSWPVAVLLAVVVGFGFAGFYQRAPVLRRFVSILSVVLVAFPALFLFGSQVRDVVSAPAAANVNERPNQKSDKSVMVVLFDELSVSSIITPDGEINAKRFPNFARLADTSTWYRGATTSGLRTDQAAPAILTGRRAPKRQVPSSYAYPNNLFTLLAQTHRIHAREFVTQLCPPELCPVEGAEETSGLKTLFTDASVVYGHLALPSDLSGRWLPPLGDRWAGFSRDAAGGGGGADPVKDWLRAAIDSRETQHEGAVFERFIRESKPKGAKPELAWLHVQVPHPPWRYLPDGTTYPAGDTTPGYRNFKWTDNQYLANEVLQRSLLQTLFADRLLGRLLDRLETSKAFEDTTLVVLSDHGATWEAGSTRRDVQGPQAGGLLGVPLFIKYPGQAEAGMDDRKAELVDVVPTIAQVTGVEMSYDTDGYSLLGKREHDDRRVFDGTEERVVDYSFKDARERAAEIEELFGDGDLYAFGPHRQLMGDRVDATALDVTFDREPYDDVRTRSPELPVFFRATTRTRAGLRVAVMLNGRVAGLGETYVEDGRTRIAVMLDPQYLKDGRNSVEVVRL